MTPRRLFCTLALAEVVTWTLLLAGMVLKYGTDTTDLLVRVGGGLHGFVFLAYAATVVLLAVDARWSPARTVAGLASAVVPYATVPFERSTERAGLLPDRWRLVSGTPATGPVERLVASGLRRPALAAVVVLALLAVVFTGLLAAGPPTQWGS